MPLGNQPLLFGAAMLGGAINSVAGGGTLLTFPALLVTGRLANVANATSTVALWPGQLSSLFGYRKSVRDSRDAMLALGIPSLIGGGIGALVFSQTAATTFAHLVPYLILAATLLFMAQGPISRFLAGRRDRASRSEQAGDARSQREGSPGGDELARRGRAPAALWAGVMAFQLVVAVYGGFFGAGIGILMLAALGLIGFTDIHRMNGLKNLNGLLINAVAIAVFILARTPAGQGIGPDHNRLVDWRAALLMAAGAILGGYGGSGLARRIGQQNVRRVVIVIGIALTLSLLLHPVGAQ